MKPRIRREMSYTMHCPMWFCRGQGRLGMGDTPSQAYFLWKYYVNKKGGVK
jgi:hypothetical protein